MSSPVEQVAQWLLGCLSPEGNMRAQSEKNILDAEKQHLTMYLEALISIILQESELSVFAAILFKKSISSCWMQSDSLSEESKGQIRVIITEKLPIINNEQIVNHLSEALSQMCVAEVTTGIHKPSYPPGNSVPYTCLTLSRIIDTLDTITEEGEDSNRFKGLLGQFSGTNGVMLMLLQYARRLLLPLHLSIKYLVESHKQTFLKAVPFDSIQTLIGLVSEKWSFAMVILADLLEEDDVSYDSEQEAVEEQELITRLSEICSVSMRLLRRLIGLGFTLSQSRQNSTEEISPELHKTLEQFAELQQSLFEGRESTRALMNNGRMKRVLEKQLVNATKAVKDLVDHYPLSMVPYLESILRFYLPKIMNSPSIDAMEENSFERKFLVYAIHCLTVSFEACRYNEVRQVIERVFEQPENMKKLLFLILTHFLPIHREEWDLCESDPQEFVQQQLLESYEYDIKASAKFLWLAMNRNFATLPPLSLAMISEFLNAPTDPQNIHEFILRREACYHGLTLCYNEFHTRIPFSKFFESMIIPDCKNIEKEYQLIKQQVCSMLCEGWAEDLGEQLPSCLQLLIHFLRENNYLVAVWGSIAFRNVCTSYTLRNLNPQLVHDFAQEAVKAMLPLSHKLQNDSITTLVVENIGRVCLLLTGSLAQGIGPQVIQGLFTLWQHGGNSCVLRNAVLRCVSMVVQAGATPNGASQVEDDLTNLILLSTDVQGRDREITYTAEGIRLWLALAQRDEPVSSNWIATRYRKDLLSRLDAILSLRDVLPHLNLQSLLALLEHHTLILFPSFFTEKANALVPFLCQIMLSTKKSWQLTAMGYIHLICQLYGQSVVPVLKDLWKVILEKSVTQDVSSEKYNPVYHQSLVGVLLRVYSLHPDAFVELLRLSNGFDSFLQIVQLLHDKLMLDGILGRLCSKFLFSIVGMENSPLKGHMDLIIHSCIRSAKEAQAPVCSCLFDFFTPEGALLEQYQNVWKQDPVNSENVVQFVVQQMSASPQLQQLIVNPKTLRYLEDAQQETQYIIIPSFGEQAKRKCPI